MNISDSTFILGPLELIQAWPVLRQVRRFKNIDIDPRPVVPKLDTRITFCCAPTGIDQGPPDIALAPLPAHAGQLMMVGAPRRQGAVSGEPMVCGELVCPRQAKSA